MRIAAPTTRSIRFTRRVIHSADAIEIYAGTVLKAPLKPPLGRAAAQLQQANALHQRGDLEGARLIYEEILKVQPKHFDALHLLGVIAAQTKNPQRAVDLIAKAIKLNPNHAATYCNRATALQALKRFDAALASYDRAIALKPDYAVAYCNRANLLKDLPLYPTVKLYRQRSIGDWRGVLARVGADLIQTYSRPREPDRSNVMRLTTISG